LDTNIFIFGLQQVNPFCVDIVRNLDKLTWNILISSMVEKEVVRNMSKHETNIFYQMMRKLDFPIDYDHPPKELLFKYKNYGFKKGDAVIAAFCEFRNIDYFISENRHFISEFQTDKFKIFPAKQFLPIFRKNLRY
jgi:hypothetical protein